MAEVQESDRDTCRDWREDGCAFPVCTCFDEPDRYGANLREVSADVREWGDATPERVRKRCLDAEAENGRLREALDEVRARWGYPKLIAFVNEVLGDA